MKKLSASVLFLAMFPSIAFCNELERLEQMGEALQKHSIEDFFSAVRANQWTAPRIPSKWFIDTHVRDDEEKRLMQTARDFGYQLALKLEDLAKEQQTLPPTDALYQRTLLLCDLGDWCAEATGYGNIFLGRRCLDLAAVGLARLTASMEFPVSLCEVISTRMQPQWMELPYRIKVLNGEANTNIFINLKMTEEMLDGQWRLAQRMLATAEHPNQAKEWTAKYGLPPSPDSSLLNVKVFTNNLNYFERAEPSEKPLTLVRCWDCRQHEWLIFWGGSQGYYQALALLKYRTIVGFFPPKFIRSEEEVRQRDAEIEKYAKLGIKMTKSEDNPSYDPLQEAFRKELMKFNDTTTEGCSYSTAVIAYKKVLNNAFFDYDTAEMQRFKNK